MILYQGVNADNVRGQNSGRHTISQKWNNTREGRSTNSITQKTEIGRMLRRSPTSRRYTRGRLRYNHSPGTERPIESAPTIEEAFRKLVNRVIINVSLYPKWLICTADIIAVYAGIPGNIGITAATVKTFGCARYQRDH